MTEDEFHAKFEQVTPTQQEREEGENKEQEGHKEEEHEHEEHYTHSHHHHHGEKDAQKVNFLSPCNFVQLMPDKI